MNKDNFSVKLAALDIDLAEAKPLDPQEREVLYATAYALYEAANYARGADLFTQLCLSSPFSATYWKGLAACRQMEGQYLASLHAWALVALLDEKDSMPHFHAAECYLSLQDKSEALKALLAAEKLLSPEDIELRAKIELLKREYDENCKSC